MKMNGREKILLISVILLLMVISVKSVAFDAFKPSTDSEKSMVVEAEQFIDQKHDGFLYTSHLLSTRIIEVAKTDAGLTKVHYRRYVLYLFPFGDEYQDIEE